MIVRILVRSQVIMTSIWYIAFCANISENTLKKVLVLVRNYVWRIPNKNSKARITWVSGALPFFHGGIKISKPLAQSQALLAKMVVRRLVQGPKP
jgi:hypothetical protein